MAKHTLETAIDAPREIVFDVFANRERWHEFMPLRVRLVEPGITDRQGVGAVREQITEFVPNEAITYEIVGGAPVRHHVGSITFADDPRGTLVRYTMESEPSVPLPRVILTLGLRLAITTMVRRGAHAARERQHS
jgi:uncharacterized protein YndB with AHSA1/START domain